MRKLKVSPKPAKRYTQVHSSGCLRLRSTANIPLAPGKERIRPILTPLCPPTARYYVCLGKRCPNNPGQFRRRMGPTVVLRGLPRKDDWQKIPMDFDGRQRGQTLAALSEKGLRVQRTRASDCHGRLHNNRHNASDSLPAPDDIRNGRLTTSSSSRSHWGRRHSPLSTLHSSPRVVLNRDRAELTNGPSNLNVPKTVDTCEDGARVFERVQTARP